MSVYEAGWQALRTSLLSRYGGSWVDHTAHNIRTLEQYVVEGDDKHERLTRCYRVDNLYKALYRTGLSENCTHLIAASHAELKSFITTLRGLGAIVVTSTRTETAASLKQLLESDRRAFLRILQDIRGRVRKGSKPTAKAFLALLEEVLDGSESSAIDGQRVTGHIQSP